MFFPSPSDTLKREEKMLAAMEFPVVSFLNRKLVIQTGLHN